MKRTICMIAAFVGASLGTAIVLDSSKRTVPENGTARSCSVQPTCQSTQSGMPGCIEASDSLPFSQDSDCGTLQLLEEIDELQALDPTSALGRSLAREPSCVAKLVRTLWTGGHYFGAVAALSIARERASELQGEMLESSRSGDYRRRVCGAVAVWLISESVDSLREVLRWSFDNPRFTLVYDAIRLLGSDASPFIDDLVGCIERTRSASAIAALGWIGPPAARALRYVVEVISEGDDVAGVSRFGDSSESEEAVDASFGTLPMLGPAGVGALISFLVHSKETLRSRAIVALRSVSASPELRVRLLAVLASLDVTFVLEATTLLSESHPSNEELSLAVRAIEGRGDTRLRAALVVGLAQSEDVLLGAPDSLARFAEELLEDQQYASAACAVLARVRPSRSTLELLLARGERGPWRSAAIAALPHVAAHFRDSVGSALSRFAEDVDSGIRAEAIGALGRIGNVTPQARRALVKGLRSPDVAVRRASLRAIASLGGSAGIDAATDLVEIPSDGPLTLLDLARAMIAVHQHDSRVLDVVMSAWRKSVGATGEGTFLFETEQFVADSPIDGGLRASLIRSALAESWIPERTRIRLSRIPMI